MMILLRRSAVDSEQKLHEALFKHFLSPEELEEAELFVDMKKMALIHQFNAFREFMELYTQQQGPDSI